MAKELQMHTHFSKHGYWFFSADIGYAWWKNIADKGKQHVPKNPTLCQLQKWWFSSDIQ